MKFKLINDYRVDFVSSDGALLFTISSHEHIGLMIRGYETCRVGDHLYSGNKLTVKPMATNAIVVKAGLHDEN